jgi:hypothetical protein
MVSMRFEFLIWNMMQTCHPGHTCSHQDLLFPRPKELKCSSNPLIGSPQHPQNALYDSRCPIGKSGLSWSRVLHSRDRVLQIPEPRWIFSKCSPCSYREFSPSRNRYLRGRESLTSRIPDSRFAMVLSASLSSLRITLSHVTCWSTRPRSFPLSEVRNCEMGMHRTYPFGTSDSPIPDATWRWLQWGIDLPTPVLHYGP